MQCAKCGVPLLNGDGLCAFCLGRQIETEQYEAISTRQLCAICKEPVLLDGNERRAYWRSKGAIRLHWLHSGACEVVARKKATYQTEESKKFQDALRASPVSNRTTKSWETRQTEMKLERKTRQNEPTFFFYFKRDTDSVGAFAVGKLLEVKIQPPTKDREFERGFVFMQTKIATPEGFDDVRVCLSDNYLANYFKEYVKGTPNNPSIVGKHVGIAAIGMTPDGKYLEYGVYAASSPEALLEEMNQDIDTKAIFGDDTKYTYQTWFNGIEVAYPEWQSKQEKPPF